MSTAPPDGHAQTPELTPAPRRVLLLTGPSGAGKSRLAKRLSAEHGWPVVPLDDYYRDHDAPDLPRRPDGLVDWDHVGAWRADDALSGLRELLTTGRTLVPTYDISTSTRVSERVVERGGAPVVLAEGIFAAHLAAELRAAGQLADLWCVTAGPWTTFGRRLVRDLAERRKPPHVLWERGHRLRRTEPVFVAHQRVLGARVISPAEGERRARTLGA
ncbi:uridine kinase [Kytococcus aerolatus]|uniref:Uridine kinase n=1 Tax=Kytococcus aerolatus TaxID=592308 RepID=A0A212TZH1_9MICO|nr:AAA family ATPase [Kytococcus aerolatus]SNC71379.1 uridine kinase [Kytococcus aerolatus]